MIRRSICLNSARIGDCHREAAWQKCRDTLHTCLTQIIRATIRDAGCQTVFFRRSARREITAKAPAQQHQFHRINFRQRQGIIHHDLDDCFPVWTEGNALFENDRTLPRTIERQHVVSPAQGRCPTGEITPAGREALALWLGQTAEMLQLHDEDSLKVVFGAFAPPGGLVNILRASIAAHEQRLAQFQEELRQHGDPTQPETWQGYPRAEGVTDPYIGMTTRLGIAFEEMYLRWLRETLALVVGD